jgi:hypothetical protein
LNRRNKAYPKSETIFSFQNAYQGRISVGMSKKTEKPSKPRKKQQKKPNRKKLIKPIIFFVKIFGLVRFGFGLRNRKLAKPQPNGTGSV